MRSRRNKTNVIMAGYKYLRSHQIRARLENFKKNNCEGCRYIDLCDYTRFLKCKGDK
jgi:hypothetical protein